MESAKRVDGVLRFGLGGRCSQQVAVLGRQASSDRGVDDIVILDVLPEELVLRDVVGRDDSARKVSSREVIDDGAKAGPATETCGAGPADRGDGCDVDAGVDEGVDVVGAWDWRGGDRGRTRLSFANDRYRRWIQPDIE